MVAGCLAAITLAAGTALAAEPNQPPNGAAPFSSAPSAATLSADPDNVIYSQTVAATAFFAAPADINIVISADAEHRITSGQLFYALDASNAVACTVERTFWVKATIFSREHSQSGYSCVTDLDRDGTYETIRPVWDVSPQLVRYANQHPPFPAAIKLTPAQAPDQRPETTFAIYYESSVLTPVLLGVRVRGSNGVTATFILNRDISSATSFPAVITLLGARLEILAREGSTLRYRVLSGIPSDELALYK
jgi:hypothetical protein